MTAGTCICGNKDNCTAAGMLGTTPFYAIKRLQRKLVPLSLPNEPPHLKTYNLYMRKQRRTADQRLCFSLYGKYHFFSTYIRNFKVLACFWDCTGRFASDGTPNGWFSNDTAQISFYIRKNQTYCKCLLIWTLTQTNMELRARNVFRFLLPVSLIVYVYLANWGESKQARCAFCIYRTYPAHP